MRKKATWWITVAVASALTLVAPTTVHAAETAAPLPAAKEAYLRDFMTMFDVPKAKQELLIDDLERGEIWDSFSGSVDPVSTSRKTTQGQVWTVDRFPDGSVVAQSIEQAPLKPGGVQPMGVNDCGYTSGKFGNYSNCNIYYWVGVVSLNFKANFSIVSGGYDRITLAWSFTYSIGAACSASIASSGIVKGTESATGKAIAGFVVNAQMCGVPFSQTFPSYLYVGSNKALHEYS